MPPRGPRNAKPTATPDAIGFEAREETSHGKITKGAWAVLLLGIALGAAGACRA